MIRVLFSVLLLSFLSSAVVAQEVLRAEYSLVHSTTAPQKRVYETSAWAQQQAKGRHTTLSSGSALLTMGEDSLTHLGKKLPFPYYDPRTESSQVQYLDVGFKIDCQANPTSDGRVLLRVRLVQSALSSDPQTPNSSNTFHSESTLLLQRGQTAIVALAQGPLTQRFLEPIYPNSSWSEGDAAMLIVTLR